MEPERVALFKYLERISDQRRGVLRERRSGEVEVMEFTPHMRPTKNLGDIGGLAATGLVKRAKPGIAVGMQEAAEPGQVSARMLAFPVG